MEENRFYLDNNQNKLKDDNCVISPIDLIYSSPIIETFYEKTFASKLHENKGLEISAPRITLDNSYNKGVCAGTSLVYETMPYNGVTNASTGWCHDKLEVLGGSAAAVRSGSVYLGFKSPIDFYSNNLNIVSAAASMIGTTTANSGVINTTTEWCQDKLSVLGSSTATIISGSIYVNGFKSSVDFYSNNLNGVFTTASVIGATTPNSGVINATTGWCQDKLSVLGGSAAAIISGSIYAHAFKSPVNFYSNNLNGVFTTASMIGATTANSGAINTTTGWCQDKLSIFGGSAAAITCGSIHTHCFKSPVDLYSNNWTVVSTAASMIGTATCYGGAFKVSTGSCQSNLDKMGISTSPVGYIESFTGFQNFYQDRGIVRTGYSHWNNEFEVPVANHPPEHESKSSLIAKDIINKIKKHTILDSASVGDLDYSYKCIGATINISITVININAPVNGNYNQFGDNNNITINEYN